MITVYDFIGFGNSKKTMITNQYGAMSFNQDEVRELIEQLKIVNGEY